MMMMDWLPYWHQNTARALTLICLPHAGGAAGMYRALRENAPSWLDVQPVQLPGREERLGEPAIDTLEHLVDQLRTVLAPCWTRPYALMGYSMGSRLAYRLAQRLIAEGQPPPTSLILAAHAWPDPADFAAQQQRAETYRQETTEAFWARLQRYGGTPAQLFEHPELMELLEPMLRADFNVAFSPLSPDRNPMAVPIMTLAGIDDPHAGPDAMTGWHHETTASFTQYDIPGGHFFLHTHAPQMHRHIVSFLSDVLGHRSTTASAVSL